MNDTKERILIESLKLFALKGFDAVSVSTIAEQVGITKGALYRHYKSKREIFDSIVKRMELSDRESAEQSNVPLTDLPNEHSKFTAEQFREYAKRQLEYWTQDGFAVNFRRMLTVERYVCREMSELYDQYLLTGPLKYTQSLFKALKIDKPEQRASELYALMYMYYGLSDTMGIAVLSIGQRHIEDFFNALTYNG